MQARQKETHHENECACWGCCCSGRSYCRYCTDRLACAPQVVLSASDVYHVYWRELNFFWGTWCFGDEETYWIRERKAGTERYPTGCKRESHQLAKARGVLSLASGRREGAWSFLIAKAPSWPPPESRCQSTAHQIIFIQHKWGKKQQPPASKILFGGPSKHKGPILLIPWKH